jgi:glutamate--cysteine ligase
MISDGYVVSLRTAVLRVLDEMDDFFKDLGFDVYDIIKYQVDKFANDDSRYAVRVKKEYGDGFVRNGLLKTLS